ncbi:hypothetical protein GCM10023322_07620 [Rugosimonospora acidiphila]|uniref:Acyl transferase domain-containing protein n=1 Tax=Rugosimonospora acidiphila TaxID=556531 RepID=A0ABP9RKE1_9ACTN
MTAGPEDELDIAIVGLSGRFPGARDVEEFWDNLRRGVESISFFDDEQLLAAGVRPEELRDTRYVRAAPVLADVDRFDARLFGYPPQQASRIDPQQRIFLECAREALEVAGYDPAKFDGSIGVYAGASIGTYLLFGDLLPQLREDYLLTVLGNDKDFLPTRVSHKLDLTGPSIGVQTACSTALVAVHLACQSLLTMESDLALAGGVSVRVPQASGYRYQEGGVLSPDGHCRAFDSGAAGTVFGSGAGVVALRRLTDALNDGDHIRAVIKASAVNNDGATKADFAAPSVIGQSRAIVEAISRAGIDPATLSYVEAHGTGTPLGDPIEVAALSAAFRAFTPATRFCAIGSVKTNIGHADAAAGIISLIKTVLALEHRLIPATLHYRRPNPACDFDNSPFYVNDLLADWAGGPGPRRAGVNCLGMGGTNAFVILEEAPPAAAAEWARAHEVLQLAAGTRPALEAASTRLAEHLAGHPELELADVAYTLRVGRADLPYRRVVVCPDASSAVDALRVPDDPSVLTAHTGSAGRDVAFLFPGQGTQYARMAAGLYRTEEVFRRQFDRCAEILRPVLAEDLSQVVYPDPAASRSEDLDRTELTQPALFAVEYALARLWMSWGIQPAACIGHSLGEYVAACVCGVFSLEDALRLVAYRGQLMSRLPAGWMLALPLSENEVRPYLSPAVCLAAVNGPAQLVVAGPAAEMNGLAERLARDGVTGHRLRGSLPFHSAAVDGVMDDLARFVAGIERHPPRIPYVSNVTGTWVADREPTDPRYWARQLRGTVRFAEGVKELIDGTDGVLLEVGPGHTLGNLARPYLGHLPGRAVLGSLPDSPGAGRRSDEAVLAATVGRLWLAGCGVDATAYHAGQRRRRVPLPTYPFERERYWIDRADPAHGAHPTPAAARDPVPAAPGGPPASANGGPARRPGGEGAAGAGDGAPVAGAPPPAGEGPTAPHTPVQAAIATIWHTVLGIDRLGVHDDFFALGGTSILIPQVLSRLNELFQVDLPALTLLESPTVAGLARRVEAVYRLANPPTAGSTTPRDTD